MFQEESVTSNVCSRVRPPKFLSWLCLFLSYVNLGQIIQHLFASGSPSVKWDSAVFLSCGSACTLHEIMSENTSNETWEINALDEY